MPRCPHGFELDLVPCTTCRTAPPKRVVRPPSHRPIRPVHPGYVDLTGQTFAGAEVIGRLDNDPRGKAQWLIRLPCGHERSTTAGHLRAPRSRWNCHVCANYLRVMTSTK